MILKITFLILLAIALASNYYYFIKNDDGTYSLSPNLKPILIGFISMVLCWITALLFLKMILLLNFSFGLIMGFLIYPPIKENDIKTLSPDFIKHIKLLTLTVDLYVALILVIIPVAIPGMLTAFIISQITKRIAKPPKGNTEETKE